MHTDITSRTSTRTAYERELRAGRLQSAMAISGKTLEQVRMDREKVLTCGLKWGADNPPLPRPGRDPKDGSTRKIRTKSMPLTEFELQWADSLDKRLNRLNLSNQDLATLLKINVDMVSAYRRGRKRLSQHRREAIDGALKWYGNLLRDVRKAA